MARASKEKKIIVGSILREKRKAAGLKQREVAKAISKSRSAYAYYETGVTMPDYDSLSKLSRIYKVPIEIFDGEGERLSAPEPVYRNDWDNSLSFADLSKFEQEIILKVRAMSKSEKERLTDYLDIKDEI
ncbi:MAG: helix-turn-helix domain-containing protein [Eubacterium sp.]